MLSLSASPVEEKLLSSWSKRKLEQDVDVDLKKLGIHDKGFKMIHQHQPKMSISDNTTGR